jgi:hypothetical protein
VHECSPAGQASTRNDLEESGHGLTQESSQHVPGRFEKIHGKTSVRIAKNC